MYVYVPCTADDIALGQIIANESTVVTFRVYPWHEDACQVFTGMTGQVEEKEMVIYEGLVDAWRGRPACTR
jgi:hypothetical protein